MEAHTRMLQVDISLFYTSVKYIYSAFARVRACVLAVLLDRVGASHSVAVLSLFFEQKEAVWRRGGPNACIYPFMRVHVVRAN